jgi:hypothetical protein
MGARPRPGDGAAEELESLCGNGSVRFVLVDMSQATSEANSMFASRLNMILLSSRCSMASLRALGGR